MPGSTLPPAVGIDLGTSFSVVARLDEQGRPATVVNAEGEPLTPSVVLVDGPDVVAGKEAVKALAFDAPRIAECAKRDMGQPNYRKPLDGQFFPPEVLQAIVLKKLVHDARRVVGDFRQAVVTVPAYFDEVRRKATQDAGYLAGIEVLDIINEPTAAAVAYGYQQGLWGAAPMGRQRVVVYDLGGGTFDVTIMEVDGPCFTTLATDGDVELGGRDWDQRLVDHVAAAFAARTGLDPRTDPLSLARLYRECEAAKRTLTARSKATIVCEHQGQIAPVEVAREEFEQLTLDLLDRTRFTTRQTLKAANLEWSQIDRVLLVGGSSRMPMVRTMLAELAGKPPDDSISADEAVAHGAALHAGAILARDSGRPAPLQIANVNSHSLGIAATDRRTGRLRNAIVIPRNTPLPVTVERTFKTHFAGQPDIWVQIIEGESASAENCTQLGQVIVGDLPRNLPAGTPVTLRFQYASNGRLTIAVRIAAGPEQTHEIQRPQSLGKEKLDAWRSWVLGSGG